MNCDLNNSVSALLQGGGKEGWIEDESCVSIQFWSTFSNANIPNGPH